jgi:P pilus assembly protein, pilin FimA
MSSGVFAYDAQINFNGELTAETCTINGSAANPAMINVSLKTVGQSALLSVGSWAMNTPFVLSFTNCPASTTVIWSPMQNVDATTGALINTIAGTNAQIRVLDDEYKAVNMNADVGRTFTGGAADLKYYAQYYAKEVPVVTGQIKTFGYITLAY